MKFILTDEKHPAYDAYRIMAKETSSRHGISVGDLGGFVSKKENLDENSEAWVFDDSVVLGNSLVTGETKVQDGAVLDNVNVGFDSNISKKKISDITLSNKVKIYGDELSIVVADKELQFGAVTANKFMKNGDSVFIGYSRFIGNSDEFQEYVKQGNVTPSDAALFEYYIPMIKRSLLSK